MVFEKALLAYNSLPVGVQEGLNHTKQGVIDFAANNSSIYEAAGPVHHGFEGLFAITGGLAVAYLVLGRRK